MKFLRGETSLTSGIDPGSDPAHDKDHNTYRSESRYTDHDTVVMRIVAIDHDIRMVMRITDTDQEYEL